jgi:uncharacterized protein (DUF58 family)
MPMPKTVVQSGIYTSLNELIDMRHHAAQTTLFSTAAKRSLLSGLHHSKLRGRGVDFDQVRLYQAGDDVRTIDWRVTARTQKPHTKLFHEERERPVFLVVEQSRQLFFGSSLMFKSVLAAQLASLIGWAALAHNDRVGGLVFTDQKHFEIRPRRSKQSLLLLLNHIAQCNQALHMDTPSNSESLGPALRRARDVLRPGSLVAIICDERALTDTAQLQLELLARHCDLLLLPLHDPLDHALPAAGFLRFAQANEQLELDTQNSLLRRSYQQAAELRQQRWQQQALKLGVPLLTLSTQHAVNEQLRDQLHALHARKTR